MSSIEQTRYGTILIDPPWAFETYTGGKGTPHRSAEDHYKTMDLHQIAGLPLPELAAPSCALFMWVVDSHFDAAFKLIDVWGFRFKTRAFTWKKLTNPNIGKDGIDQGSKPRIGMGYWTRKQTEVCLLATRGTPKRLDKGVRELIEAPRREHSRKPEEQYERIERLVGGPYLEMFARQRRAGWDSWGNEVDKFSSEVGEFD